MTKQRQKNNHGEQHLQYSNQQYTNTDEEPTWKRHRCKERVHHQLVGSRKEQGDQYHTNTDDESLFYDLDEYLEGKDMFMIISKRKLLILTITTTITITTIIQHH